MNQIKISKLRFLLGLMLLSVVSVTANSQQVCHADLIETTPSSRFEVDLEKNTVLDTDTGLTWKRCSQGKSGEQCEIGAALIVTWHDALASARNESFADKTDWRVPNIKELASITEFSCSQPAINLVVFPNTDPKNFWSSSAFDPDGNDSAWQMEFTGRTGVAGGSNTVNRVRLVRGRQR